jgi:CRISPR-associated protein Cas1
MKHMSNTLYVTQPKSFLYKEGNTVVVKQEEQKVIQLPIHTIGQIVCFGFDIVVTAPLMAFCAENNVSIAWLTETGRFLGRVEGPIKGNVLLRREQHRWADDAEKSLGIARSVVAAKINNGRTSLLRFLRNQPGYTDQEKIQFQIDKLAKLLTDTSECTNLDSLRGIEGEAAYAYFSVFDHMIVQQKESFQFKGRSRRPPRDRVNAMLSYLYTILVFDMRSALETVGLDPYVGFLHADRPGRPSLALDLMEEFRAPLADRLILGLINRKQVQAKHFTEHGTGEVLMNEECRKILIGAYQNRKKEAMVHPFLEEKMEIGLFFQTQALLLARHIRGDIEFYPAAVWK